MSLIRMKSKCFYYDVSIRSLGIWYSILYRARKRIPAFGPTPISKALKIIRCQLLSLYSRLFFAGLRRNNEILVDPNAAIYRTERCGEKPWPRWVWRLCIEWHWINNRVLSRVIELFVRNGDRMHFLRDFATLCRAIYVWMFPSTVIATWPGRRIDRGLAIMSEFAASRLLRTWKCQSRNMRTLRTLISDTRAINYIHGETRAGMKQQRETMTCCIFNRIR